MFTESNHLGVEERGDLNSMLEEGVWEVSSIFDGYLGNSTQRLTTHQNTRPSSHMYLKNL